MATVGVKGLTSCLSTGVFPANVRSDQLLLYDIDSNVGLWRTRRYITYIIRTGGRPGATFSKLLRKILGKFLILGNL